MNKTITPSEAAKLALSYISEVHVCGDDCARISESMRLLRQLINLHEQIEAAQAKSQDKPKADDIQVSMEPVEEKGVG